MERALPRDLICLSHLRWNFVYQRPNHLMARAAKDRRVYFVEEPRFEVDTQPTLASAQRDGLTVVTPVLPADLADGARDRELARLMSGLMVAEGIVDPTLWYYTPMALPWTRHLPARAVIYDSMDYLAGFLGAPAGLLDLETELLGRADAVLCGGRSLHERMRERHARAHCFPSSVDVDHFATARTTLDEPADQAGIARPRIGYAGVIDERIDVGLIDALALARPDWEIVLLGPVVKIQPESVPAHRNVHLLGMKAYAELPAYLGGWDVGWMPFARNEATRYISPTKTPEYLAAGLPVVSTSIADVVEPYGRKGLVAIANSVEATVDAVERALQGEGFQATRVDAFLAERSWDRTWAAMAQVVEEAEAGAAARRTTTRPAPVAPLGRRVRRDPEPVGGGRAAMALSASREVG
jgi:UDP-galactopyranose mutase